MTIDPFGNAPIAYGQDRVSSLLTATAEGAVEQLRALAADVQLAYAPNTLRTWRADWRVWCDFCSRQDYSNLPVELGALRAFLLDRVAAGRKRATIEHYLSTLTVVHRLAKLPSPMDSLEARLMWRGIRREYLTERQRQAKGLTADDVDEVIEHMDLDNPRDVRDAALLSVAYETMLRRAELIAVQVQDIAVEQDGSGSVFLGRSKTDQEGKGALLYISPATVEMIEAWIGIAGIADGALFRSVPNSKKPDRFKNPLSDRDVARIFKRIAAAAGIDAESISGHSTRVGATQDLLEANISGPEIMRQGRWRTERMITRYGEHLAVKRSAMAKLRGGRLAKSR